MDFAYTIQLIPVFLERLPFTLGAIALGFSFGFVLALLVTLGRINRIPVLSPVLDLYVSFIRCIPSVLLLFLVYYGLPFIAGLLFSVDMDSMAKIFFGVFSLILFNGGRISEILRAAFLSVPKEQSELADSLGYSRLQKLWHVVMSQAIPIAIPDLGNALIDVMKDTSLFFTIGIVDMMGTADIYVGNNYGVKQAEIYLSVACVYWLCSLILTGVIRLAGKKWSYSRLSKGIVGKI